MQIASFSNPARIRTVAQSLTRALKSSGLTEVSEDRVCLTLERLKSTHISLEKAGALKELLGNRWTTATFVRVAGALDRALDWQPALPGHGSPDPQPEVVKLIGALTSPPQQKYTISQLEGLGFSTPVARNLLETQPEIVRDLALWSQADQRQSRPRDLYRGLALPGGPAGYDPERVGTVNDEMFFASSRETALAFGMDRLKAQPEFQGVLVHAQVPAFMVETSPPQGGDAVWPILRSTSFQNPDHPDLRPFLAEVSTFQFDPNWNGRII